LIGRLNRMLSVLLLGAALGGEEPDVAPDHLDRLVNFAKLPHPVITEAQAHAAEQRPLADPAGDAREDEKLLAKHRVRELGVELVVFAVEGDQPRQPGGVLDRRGRGGLTGVSGRGRLLLGLGRRLRGRRLGRLFVAPGDARPNRPGQGDRHQGRYRSAAHGRTMQATVGAG